jgi:hypothetical protein
MDQVTFTYGGIDFYADVEVESVKDWAITEIYIDDGREWKFQNGLYDVLSKHVINAANDAIFEQVFEIITRRHSNGEL